MRIVLGGVAVLALAIGGAGALRAQTGAGAVDARAFGAREDVRQVSISPDGKRLAMVRAAAGAGTALYVADLTGDATPRPILTSSGRPDQLTGCSWSTATRLVCNISTLMTTNGMRLGYSRVLTLNADGSDMKPLSGETRDRIDGFGQFGGGIIDFLADDAAGGDAKGGSVLMTRDYGAQMTTGSITASTASGLGVERVDTTTLRRQQVERPSGRASEYITDGHGTVRIMGITAASDSGMLRGRTTYMYRKAGDRSWQPLSVVSDDGGVSHGFDPYAVDRDANVAYGFDDHGGRQALYRVALDGSLKRELVLDRPDVDVDSLIRIGRQQRVVGASFATDRRERVIFDPALKALAASLGRALPKQPIVSIVDASADEQKLVLFAGSDVDPGSFYLFDRTAKKLSPILSVRPPLGGRTLASVKPISFKAADGTMIPAYLTLPAGSSGKGLPAIVLPHGGPGDRDEWGFDWLPQFFAARGYAVLQPNFRGSTGYGAAWFQKNGFQSWRTAIGDVNDAGRYLVSQGIAAPDKLAIVGWSYGGYAALQSQVIDPQLFKAVVAIAPVTDLNLLIEENRKYSGFVQYKDLVGQGPHTVAGSPARQADKFQAPVLLFHGELDQNVADAHSELMERRLKAAGKSVRYIAFDDLEHDLDSHGARSRLLLETDMFLSQSLGQ